MHQNQLNFDSFNISELPPANPILFNPKQKPFSVNSIYNFPFYKTPECFNTDIVSIPSVVNSQNFPQVQTEERISLSQYYQQFKQCLVYSKIPLEHPTVIKEQMYFATILSDLNKPAQNKSKTLTDMPQVRFTSQFESGNLLAAFERSRYNFDLILQNDINTKGNTQWFFFCVQGIPAGITINFRIINLYKKHSLFEKGLLPAVFSEASNCGWVRTGINVGYGKGFISRGEKSTYYMLNFSYLFQRNNDKVYFAHSYPYTFTRLNIFLNNLCSVQEKGMYLSRRTFCKTLCGNNVELITITSNSIKLRKDRKAIMIIARQHPGEPQGSYVMEGIIRFLTGPTAEAQLLREICIFKIIPMMNPDGVIHGNYRTSLTGQDMNRQWKECIFRINPEVYSVKHYVTQLKMERDFKLFLDLHGHSRQLYSFFYGVESNDSIKQRLYPYMVSKIDPSFNFKLCSFNYHNRERTARVSISRQIHSASVYTVESSFFGKKSDEGNNIEHFTIQDYIKIGESLCQALHQLMKDEFSEFKRYSNLSEKQKLEQYKEQETYFQQIQKELVQTQNNEIEKNDSGSDSDPSEDEFKNDEIQSLLPRALNRKMQFTKQNVQKSKDDKSKNTKSKTLRSSFIIQNTTTQKTLNISPTFISIIKQVNSKKTSKQYLSLEIEKQMDVSEPQIKPDTKDQWTQTDYYLYQDWLDANKKKQRKSVYKFMDKPGYLKANGNRPQYLSRSPKVLSLQNSERQFPQESIVNGNDQYRNTQVINQSKSPQKYPLIEQLIEQLKMNQSQTSLKGNERKGFHFNASQKRKTEASIDDRNDEYYLERRNNKLSELPQLKRIQRKSELSLGGFLKQKSIGQARLTTFQ